MANKVIAQPALQLGDGLDDLYGSFESADSSWDTRSLHQVLYRSKGGPLQELATWAYTDGSLMPISEARYKKAWKLNNITAATSSSTPGEGLNKPKLRGQQTSIAASSHYTSDTYSAYLTDWNACMAGLLGFFKSHNLAAMLQRCVAPCVQLIPGNF